MKYSLLLNILVFAILFLVKVESTELILRPNIPTCSVLVSSFDPIKVEARFPSIGSKVEGEKFKITLINLRTQKVEQQKESEDNKIYRTNFHLESNIVYQVCFQFVTNRQLGPNAAILVGFKAEENFEEMIGQLQVPPELANEQNLQQIYEVGWKMSELNEIIVQRQKKQRELEDKLVDLSSHKSKRIFTMTIIECAVIVISGVYQIFALRKILIQRNLY